jgi:hypothetical protein
VKKYQSHIRTELQFDLCFRSALSPKETDEIMPFLSSSSGNGIRERPGVRASVATLLRTLSSQR